MPSTREQKRAQIAFERVDAVRNEPWAEDYGRQAKQLPALIHQCGACQALTFLDAKGGPARQRLLSDLAEALQYARPEQLLADARGSETPTYHLLGRSALRCAEWFKRYAEALLKIDQPTPEEET